MLENGEDIPLHTVKGWAARGPFRVKKVSMVLKQGFGKRGKEKTRTLPRMKKKTLRKRPTEIFIWQRLFFSELIKSRGWQNKDLFHDPLDALNPRP